jgi:hypothetical protein
MGSAIQTVARDGCRSPCCCDKAAPARVMDRPPVGRTSGPASPDPTALGPPRRSRGAAYSSRHAPQCGSARRTGAVAEFVLARPLSESQRWDASLRISSRVSRQSVELCNGLG